MNRLFIISVFTLLLSSCGGLSSIKGPTAQEINESDRNDEQFQRYFFEGQKYKALDQKEKAYSSFEVCLTFNTEEPAVYYEMARIDHEMMRESSAKDLVKKAIELDSENKWYFILLAEIHNNLGSYAEAAEAYGKAISLYPKDYPLYKKRGKCLEYANNFKGAIEIYDELERLTAISEELSLKKYDLYLVLGNTAAAESELKALIDADPSEIRYYGILAEFYSAQGRGEEAMSLYEQMAEIDPDNGVLNWQLAQHYEMIGQHEKAHEELKKAFGSLDVDVELKNQLLEDYLGRSEKDRKFLSEGIELISILMDFNGSNDHSLSLAGTFYLFNGEMEKAAEAYREATKLNANDITAWRGLIMANYSLADWEVLEDDCSEVLETFPLQPEFFLFSGFAKLKLNEINKAIVAFKTGRGFIVEDESMEAVFLMLLSRAYQIEGNKEKYADHYESSISSAATVIYSDREDGDIEMKFGRTMISKSYYHLGFLWYEGLMMEIDHGIYYQGIGEVYEDFDIPKYAEKYYQLAIEKGGDKEELEKKIKDLE